jgi:hypothetical protein
MEFRFVSQHPFLFFFDDPLQGRANFDIALPGNFVEYNYAAFRQRPNGKFSMQRMPNFPNYEHIERRPYRPGDLIARNDPSARKGKHDHVVPVFIAIQPLCKPIARFAAIAKHIASLLSSYLTAYFLMTIPYLNFFS